MNQNTQERLIKVANLLTLASVVRNEDVDFYLDQIGKLLSADGYDKGKKAVTLFNKLKSTYDLSTAEKLRAALRDDGYESVDTLMRLVTEMIKTIRSVEVVHETTAIDVENRKAARETIGFLTALLPKLNHVAENCKRLNLDEEASHVGELRAQFEDILLTISRLLERGLEGKK